MVSPLSNEPFPPSRPCCGWRDALVGSVMTSTVVGSGALALFAKNLYALPFGGALIVVEGVIWFCWRKDATIADMRRTTQEMADVAGALERGSDRAVSAVTRLNTTGEALRQDRVALEHAQALAAKEVEQLQQQLRTVQEELDALRSENGMLKTNIADLQKKLDQMRSIVQQFAALLQEKGKLQADLAEKLKQGQENIAEFAEVGQTFTIDMGRIDTVWDENVQNFEKAIQSFNVNGQALLQQVQDELTRFADQVHQAGITEGRLKQDVEDLKQALAALQQVSLRELPLGASHPDMSGWGAVVEMHQQILDNLRRSHATHQPGSPSHAGGQ